MYFNDTLKTAVVFAFLGAATIAVPVTGANAEPQFDKKLAKVLADKAAAMLGDLRGGYTLEDGAGLAPEEEEAGWFNQRTPDDSAMLIAPYVDRTTTSSIESDAWLLPRTDIRVVYTG
ncbi:hypothetical protein [Oricola indica]|uniref:hypothetical protein n=1 Tax=Oricola indica TaxID=2872591 RepID=UPI003CCBE88B